MIMIMIMIRRMMIMIRRMKIEWNDDNNNPMPFVCFPTTTRTTYMIVIMQALVIKDKRCGSLCITVIMLSEN